MKKVLFASTALVLSAGVASAELSFSGSAAMGVVNSAAGATSIYKDFDLDATGTATTDGGITLTAKHAFEAGAGAANGTVALSYEGLTLTIGEVGEGSDVAGLSDVGISGLGVDDVAEIADHGDHDVAVGYSFGDISVSASADSDNDNYGIGVSGSFSGVTVALGMAETGGQNHTVAKLGYTAGAVSGAVVYQDNGTATSQGLEISYTSGDVTVTGVYAESGGTSATGLGIAYDLGGATLSGGVANLAAGTAADLGISFSF